MYTFSRSRAAAFVALSVAAMSISTTSPAAAEGNITVSNGNGTMRFIDSGDRFEVCDTRVNGVGVEGYLGRAYPKKVLRSEQDGGDAGCDYFTFDIPSGNVYYISICDIGATFGCDSAFFEE